MKLSEPTRDSRFVEVGNSLINLRYVKTVQRMGAGLAFTLDGGKTITTSDPDRSIWNAILSYAGLPTHQPVIEE